MSKVILFLIDDLHLEYRPKEMQDAFAQELHSQLVISKNEGNIPILVCAGDISEKDAGIEWVSQFKVDTVYVCGNHEFWNNDFYEVIDIIREKVKQPGYEHIHFLNNDEVILHGVRFLGATLWTELGQSWAWSKRNYILKHFFSMADFRKITARKFYKDTNKVDEMFKMLIENGVDPEQATNLIATESFNPLIQIEENSLSIDFIKNKIQEPFLGKTVVVTHHLPVPDLFIKNLDMNEDIFTAPYINNKSVYKEYKKQKIPPEKDILMAGFYINNAHYLFCHDFSPDIWLHGHFHNPVDNFIGTTRIVSAPVGYLKQSDKIKIKQIVIGNEIRDYIDNSIREIEAYNWEEKINKTLKSFKQAISDFSKPIIDGQLNVNSFSPILTVFQEHHQRNLKDVEMFVSNILYNLIKMTNKKITIPNQLYITSFKSGFGKWASKNEKVYIDMLNLTLNEKSFLSEEGYKKNNDDNKNELEHFSDWIKEIDKIDSQVLKFKKILIDFFNYLKESNNLDYLINQMNQNK